MKNLEQAMMDKHRAAVTIRKALHVHEASGVFVTVEDYSVSMDIMADYCVQALKDLGEWREEDDEDAEV